MQVCCHAYANRPWTLDKISSHAAGKAQVEDVQLSEAWRDFLNGVQQD